MSLWWWACPGRFLAMLWRLGINSELVCLVLCLHSCLHKPDIFSVWRISLCIWKVLHVFICSHMLFLHTCALFFFSSQQGFNMCCCGYQLAASRAAWPMAGKLVGGDEPTRRESRRGGRVSCLASWGQFSLTQSHHNHMEFSQCVLWASQQL